MAFNWLGLRYNINSKLISMNQIFTYFIALSSFACCLLIEISSKVRIIKETDTPQPQQLRQFLKELKTVS